MSVEPVDILLVEDNSNDLELTLRAFKKHRLTNRIFVVKDGAQALDFIFCKGAFADRKPAMQPRVVLLDLKLPKVDGLEVLGKMKSNERTKIIPVVVLTSSREEKDVVESYNLGVNSYIVKPLDFDKFIDSVAQLGLYWMLLNEPPR